MRKFENSEGQSIELERTWVDWGNDACRHCGQQQLNLYGQTGKDGICSHCDRHTLVNFHSSISSCCLHKEEVYVKKPTKNGSMTYAYQCQNCGHYKTEGISKNLILNAGIDPESLTMIIDYVRKNNFEWHVYNQDLNAISNRNLRERHYASDKWKELRRRIIVRDKNQCQYCMNAPIEHVHHRTYERLGDEALFDLVGVCVKCHDKIHERRPLENEHLQNPSTVSDGTGLPF